MKVNTLITRKSNETSRFFDRLFRAKFKKHLNNRVDVMNKYYLCPLKSTKNE
jgi:hypothetical protein